MVDLKIFRELCRKAAEEEDTEKLEIIKEQMKIILSNDEADPLVMKYKI